MSDELIWRRAFAKNLYLVTDLTQAHDEIRESIRQTMKVELAVDKLLNGTINAEEFLELVESANVNDMDSYIDDACDNIESFLAYQHVLATR